MDKISVIIPVYNVEAYLKRCLDSVVNQTYNNLEIIIVDDGSTDNSPEICDEYAKNDSRIHVIHKENGGVSVARNLGIEEATGEYIAFVDSDDYIDAKMYEILLNNCIKYNADISICDFISTDSEKEPSIFSDLCISMKSNDALLRLYTDKDVAFVSLWGKIFKSELWKDIRLPNIKCAEDNFVLYKLLYKANRVAFDESKLYKYYQRSNSEVHTFDKSSSFDFIAFDEQMSFWEEQKNDKLLTACFVRNFKRLIMTLDCAQNANKSDDFYSSVLGRYYETTKKHIDKIKIGPIEKKLFLLDWKDIYQHKVALLFIRLKSKIRNL